MLATAYDFWRQPVYLILLFTSLFAAISNLDYWLRIGRGKMSIGGSSIAHVGFALILLGALISNAKKKIISETEVFLSEDLPSNENALLELKDTVALGNYMAVWNGMRDENSKQFYDVTYYEKQSDSTLKESFELQPFLQMSDQMGPTPNPSTKHYWDRDIYTHVTYSSYLEPRTDDGYAGEVEAEFSRGDTVIYEQHFIVMDSLKVNAAMNEETREMASLTLTAKMSVINVLGESFEVAPQYILEGNMLSHEDVFMEEQGFKIRFSDVNTESNKIKITLWTQVPEDEKPFIVMKAIIFPLINLLWAGCILMAIGTGISVWQRVRKG